MPRAEGAEGAHKNKKKAASASTASESGKAHKNKGGVPMMVVRANCNASDEASVVVALETGANLATLAATTLAAYPDDTVEPGSAGIPSKMAAASSLPDENVIMRLTFGSTLGSNNIAPYAYQTYEADSLTPADEVSGIIAGGRLFGSIIDTVLSPLDGAPGIHLMPSQNPAVHPRGGPMAASAAGTGISLSLSKVVRLLAEFEEKGKAGEWPLSTSVHCYWCTHRFDTPPVGLPVRYMPQTGKFQTIGCFCSLQCACAYNFDSNRDSEEECMARYSLLCALSAKLGWGRVVKPAPSKLALSIYGGHMSIDEFRAYCNGNGSQLAGGAQRQIIITCPPMQSVTQQVEDIAETDMSSEYRYVPLDNDRVQRVQERVRLQRTKPLSDMKNTLDRTMKLKYTVKTQESNSNNSASIPKI